MGGPKKTYARKVGSIGNSGDDDGDWALRSHVSGRAFDGKRGKWAPPMDVRAVAC